MPEYSAHQRKIIDRYYTHRDTIMLNKLSELVAELYLADTDKKKDQLWKRVATAMKNLKIPQATADHILAGRSAEQLARHLKDWMGRSS